jgi:stage III sporulation protein AB
MGKAFDKEDRMLFLRLGDFIGVQDDRMQNEVIESCLEQIKDKCEILEKERPEKERLYRVLSFSISGFLILLFI